MRTTNPDINLAAIPQKKNGYEWFVIVMRDERTKEQLGMRLNAFEADQLLCELRNYLNDHRAKMFAKDGFTFFEKEENQ